MLNQKIFKIFWSWLKITLPTFVGLSTIILLMLVLFTIFRVPSLIIGNDSFWLLRWQHDQNSNYSISFNPFFLFYIASAIGLVGLCWKYYYQNYSRKKRKRRRI